MVKIWWIFDEIWGLFWGFLRVFGVGRGSPKSSKNVIFGQNRGWGDGLGMSLNAKNHANFRSFFAKRGGHFSGVGWPFSAFREPIYVILSARPGFHFFEDFGVLGRFFEGSGTLNLRSKLRSNLMVFWGLFDGYKGLLNFIDLY
jgi:hypothetical protein